MTHTVRHCPASQRFLLETGEHLAHLDYQLEGRTMSIAHTRVPEAIAGRGFAALLTRAALEEARRNNWQVIPLCSYVAAYMLRHPEHDDLRG